MEQEYISEKDLRVNIARWLSDYFLFVKECLGSKDANEYHKKLCRLLQNGTRKFKLILLPRHTFKSTMATIDYSIYRIVLDPNIRILIYSASATKAQGFLTGIKNHFENKASNSKFVDYFGVYYPQDKQIKWNDGQIIVNKRTHHSVEPTVDVGGIETSKVGMHYDLIIFDDIVDDINTTTKIQMDKVHDCYRKSLALLKPDGEVIILGTRWHYGDTYGRIIENNKTTDRFDIMCLDAEETNEDGNLIFADVGLTREFLNQQKQEQGSFIYSCIYRNSPVNDETALFKFDNFNYYELTPKFEENLFITCTCDPAGEGEDFTAITVVGTSQDNKMYILDAINEHLKPAQIVDWIFRLNYKWKFTRLGVETNYFRGTLEKEIRLEREKHSKNPNFTQFSIEEILASRTQGNFNRVLALQPYHERKAIYLPGKDFYSLPKSFSELAYQMLQYTMDGAKSPHDDLIISLSFHLLIKCLGGKVKEQDLNPTCAAALERKWFDDMNKAQRVMPMKYRRRYQMSFN